MFTIPAGAQLILTETVLPTDVNYQTTAVATKDSNQSAVGTFNSSKKELTLTTTQTAENLTVTFVNKEVYVAPTGLDLRKVPFLVLMIAGAILMIAAQRRRKCEDEE